MGDNSIESSGAFGIPKWMMRKGMRYEIDDFIVSPPSNEDGGFFHLRYGRCPSPRTRPSNHDCANQEVAMTVEVRDGDPVITDIRSPNSSDSNSPSASFAISPGDLSSETTPVSTPDATAGKVVPLLVLPLNFRDSRTGKDTTCIENDESTERNVELSKQEDFLSAEQLLVQDEPEQILSESQSLSVKNITDEKKERKISLVEKVQQIPLEPDSLSTEGLSTTDEKKQRKISLVEKVQQMPLEVDSLSSESFSTTDEKKQRKISFVERVQQIPLTAESLASESTPASSEVRRRKISFVERRFQMLPFSADQITDNISPQRTPPQTSPLITPHSTPPTQRKPFGVNMEKVQKSTIHSYFCTKPFHGTEQDCSTALDMSSQTSEVSLSSTSSVRAQQLEDNTKLAQSLDPNNKAVLGKRRPKPKPSTLREMNFWAPTSM